MTPAASLEDLTLPFTCPECGDTGTRERYAQVSYSCPECNLSVAHIDLAPTGMVREVFGWLLPPGELLFDRYRVVGLLGRGGFAATYACEDTRLGNRRCALKEVPKVMFDDGEAAILSRLHHPGIPDITDRFEHGEMVYLVLEFGGTKSLAAERVERGGRVPAKYVVPWIHQLCEVLRYLHSQDPPVVHRDLKPGNVLLNDDGDIKLIDFGIAKESSEGSQTRTIARSASHGFSPPEQVLGTGTDQRSDVYALAATLYQLLTGHKPPPAHERVAGAALVPPSERSPDTGPALEALITRALELNINQRVQSIAEFEEELESITAGTAAHPIPPSLATPPKESTKPTAPRDAPTVHLPPPSARKRGPSPVLLGGIGAALVFGAAAAWWISQDSDPAKPATSEAVAAEGTSQPDSSLTAAQPPAPDFPTIDPSIAAPPAPTSGGTAAASSGASALDILKARRPAAPVEETKPATGTGRAAPKAAPRRVAAPKPPPKAPSRRVAAPKPAATEPPPSPKRTWQVADPKPPANKPAASSSKSKVDWGGGFKSGRTIKTD